jgi:HAD superfamily hydrolase (TIGR01484 family)
MSPRLICTDLDRTLLPNGDAPESPGARDRLARIVADHAIDLVFVTGRHLALVQDAIAEYQLPHPRFAICDVGTSIYGTGDGQWHELASWWERLAAEWPESDTVIDRLERITGLRIQEPERQTPFKISWYAPLLADPGNFLNGIYQRLGGLTARLVYSVDERAGTGLLDVIPLRAGKLAAIEHLLQVTGIGRESTLFAGDSGNDLDVLASPIPAVLVANATAEVRSAALDQAEAHGTTSRLYVARGDFADMNGNYAAGILEGLAHFWPETREWIR